MFVCVLYIQIYFGNKENTIFLFLFLNSFTEIPAVVYELTNLEILNAKGNLIALINVDGLMKLKRLAVLDLSDNNISYVPPELGNMTMLR